MNQPIQGKPGRYWHVLQDGRMRIPAIAITCSDASRSGIPIDREQCGVGA